MGEKQKLKNYLLENLPPEEMEALDLDVLAHPEREVDLLEAEHELIEDYLEGAMTDEERGRFVRRFLVSRERRRLFDEIERLKNYARARDSRPADRAEANADDDFIAPF